MKKSIQEIVRRTRGRDTTAEHFAHTVNKLKGKVTMLFITHQLPKALQVDEVIEFGRSEAGAGSSVEAAG